MLTVAVHKMTFFLKSWKKQLRLKNTPLFTHSAHAHKPSGSGQIKKVSHSRLLSQKTSGETVNSQCHTVVPTDTQATQSLMHAVTGLSQYMYIEPPLIDYPTAITSSVRSCMT